MAFKASWYVARGVAAHSNCAPLARLTIYADCAVDEWAGPAQQAKYFSSKNVDGHKVLNFTVSIAEDNI